jgi:hypothetical protein
MKESYIKMRNSGKYEINWFYNYFLEQGGKRIDMNSFRHLFNFGDLNSTLEYLDSKFEVTKLETLEDKLIKIL